MKIDIRLQPNSENLIISAFRQRFIDQLRGVVRSKIKQKIQDTLEVALNDSPEINSLLGGVLQSDFGIENPGPIVDEMVKRLSNSVRVILRVGGRAFKNNNKFANLQVTMVKSDYSDLFNIKGTSYTSNGTYRIPWLHWLLFGGTEVVVANYDVKYLSKQDFRRRFSRSGDALMFKSSDGFNVGVEFAGTKEDNFVTRALQAITPKMEKILREELAKVIK